MNKAELIAAMATRSGLSRKQAGDALALLTDSIIDALKADDRVAIPNFGIFIVRQHVAYERKESADR